MGGVQKETAVGCAVGGGDQRLVTYRLLVKKVVI